MLNWPSDTPLPPNLISITTAVMGGFKKVIVKSWEDPTFRVVVFGYTTDDDGARATSIDNSAVIGYYDPEESCWVALFCRPS